MDLNEEGLNLIKSFEKCCLESYKDGGGVWTVGWGCTHHVREGMTITEGEASIRLKEDLGYTITMVKRALGKRILNDNQFSALVSFTYNVGVGTFRSSTLLQCILMGHYEDASLEFMRFNKDNGVIQKGLVARRLAEQALFNSSPSVG